MIGILHLNEGAQFVSIPDSRGSNHPGTKSPDKSIVSDLRKRLVARSLCAQKEKATSFCQFARLGFGIQ